MKTILITGCSSGFGRATAVHFHEQGWNVVATMRTPEKAEGFPRSERLRLVRLDVTDAATIASALREALLAFGAIDVVVNNAGIGMLSAFEATPDHIMREIFDTNTFGPMAVARAVIPHMRERRQGLIINVTSSVALLPMPLVAIYCASKLAVEGFTESLDYELSCFGVRAKLVEPGYAPTTAFTPNGMERMKGLLPEPYAAYTNQLMERQHHQKHTVAADVARAVWLAATDDSATLRYCAGPDAEDIATMRRTMPGESYLPLARRLMGPR